MENIPFNSSDDDESKPSDFYEFAKDSEEDDDDDSESKKSKKKTRRSVLFGESSSDKSPDGKDKETDQPPKGRESLFSGILKSEHDADDKEEGNDNESANDEEFVEFASSEGDGHEGSESAELKEEFEQVVEDKMQGVELALEDLAAPEEELIANASLLSTVADRLEDGTPPSEAIEEATQEVIDTQEPDTSPDFMGVRPPLDIDKPPTPVIEREEMVDDPVIAAPVQPEVQPILTPIPSATETSSPDFPRPILTPESPGVSKMNSLYYRDGRRGGLLMGGALGYLFGRRRGRIKTEASMQPELNTKDSEIDKLQGDLERSETKVRANAVEIAAKNLENVAVETAAQERQEQDDREKEFLGQISKEESAVKVEITEDTAREKPVEIVEDTAERIGDIDTEFMSVARAAEKQQKATVEKSHDVKTMGLPELLEVADNIKLEHTSLRELYEYKRIDAVSLRNVVVEYVNGNNYERLLRGSLEAVEMQQEIRNEVKYYDSDDPSSVGSGYEKSNATSSSLENINLPMRSEADLADQNSLQQNLLGHYERKKSQKPNNIAIALGIVAGVVLMAIALLYSS